MEISCLQETRPWLYVIWSMLWSVLVSMTAAHVHLSWLIHPTSSRTPSRIVSLLLLDSKWLMDYCTGPTILYSCSFETVTYLCKVFQQVAFVFTIGVPSVWGMIDNLVTQGLQPWNFRVFWDLVRKVKWMRAYSTVFQNLVHAYVQCAINVYTLYLWFQAFPYFVMLW